MLEQNLKAVRRSNALLQAASGDFLLREQLATDPANILHEYVHGETLPEATASASNHLLHALLSSPQMLGMLKEIASRHSNGIVDDETLANELSAGLQRDSDRAVVTALMRFGISSDARIEPAFDLVRTILGALGRGGRSFGGTEMTPGTGTGTGTEMTPGTGTGTGTEMTPGTGTGTGTEMTPGTGTGTGTEMTPGTGTGTGTEMTPGTGTGTESTPGTGTESSPGTGTGTEASLGDLFGRDLGELQAAMRALINFSVQLRRSGVLYKVGFN